MLKAGNISGILSHVSNELAGVIGFTPSGISVCLTLSDGSLLASSTPASSEEFDSCQRACAVAASVATEYKALERIMASGFRSVLISTDCRLVLCDMLIETRHNGPILLIASIGIMETFADKSLQIGTLRALVTRLKSDCLPCLTPVLESLTLVPPDH